MLCFRGLTVRRGDDAVLSGCDARFENGSLHRITGALGDVAALLHAVFGDLPYSGECESDGAPAFVRGDGEPMFAPDAHTLIARLCKDSRDTKVLRCVECGVSKDLFTTRFDALCASDTALVTAAAMCCLGRKNIFFCDMHELFSTRGAVLRDLCRSFECAFFNTSEKKPVRESFDHVWELCPPELLFFI